jgi:hypothetical protein
MELILPTIHRVDANLVSPVQGIGVVFCTISDLGTAT